VIVPTARYPQNTLVNVVPIVTTVKAILQAVDVSPSPLSAMKYTLKTTFKGDPKMNGKKRTTVTRKISDSYP
jgi:hypothetical protein